MKSARKSDIRMEEINFSFVVGYEDYLNAQGLARNTINYYLRNFRTIYNSSIRDGFKPKSENPFTYIQTKPCKTIKRAINKDDMKNFTSAYLPVSFSEWTLRGICIYLASMPKVWLSLILYF